MLRLTSSVKLPLPSLPGARHVVEYMCKRVGQAWITIPGYVGTVDVTDARFERGVLWVEVAVSDDALNGLAASMLASGRLQLSTDGQ